MPNRTRIRPASIIGAHPHGRKPGAGAASRPRRARGIDRYNLPLLGFRTMTSSAPTDPPCAPSVTAVTADLSLEAKVSALRQDFGALLPAAIAVYPSPPTGYRMRAEFRIWHRDERCHYAMYRPGESGTPYVIDDFPPGAAAITRLMPPLLAALNATPELRRRLFAAEFLTTMAGDALITLIYHRALTPVWQDAARTLADHLNCSLIGRSRKQKIVIGRDHVIQTLSVAGRRYCWQQIESAFTQPNAVINREMLAWTAEQARNLGGDLLELYCGNGNFTLVLAAQFERVLATEVAKLSVRAAHHNLAANGIDNVALVRMSSEEVGQALAGVRPFRRLRDIDLGAYRFSTLLVDPPRAGLDATTLALAKTFRNIFYISCNPQTLKSNLVELNATHRVAEFAVFDQFPGTHHLECGALLVRR